MKTIQGGFLRKSPCFCLVVAFLIFGRSTDDCPYNMSLCIYPNAVHCGGPYDATTNAPRNHRIEKYVVQNHAHQECHSDISHFPPPPLGLLIQKLKRTIFFLFPTYSRKYKYWMDVELGSLLYLIQHVNPFAFSKKASKIQGPISKITFYYKA